IGSVAGCIGKRNVGKGVAPVAQPAISSFGKAIITGAVYFFPQQSGNGMFSVEHSCIVNAIAPVQRGALGVVLVILAAIGQFTIDKGRISNGSGTVVKPANGIDVIALVCCIAYTGHIGYAVAEQGLHGYIPGELIVHLNIRIGDEGFVG